MTATQHIGTAGRPARPAQSRRQRRRPLHRPRKRPRAAARRSRFSRCWRPSPPRSGRWPLPNWPRSWACPSRPCIASCASSTLKGLLQREPHRRVYGPGPRLLNFALGAVRSSMRSAPRHAVLEALSAKVGETCNFGMIAGNAVLYLDRVEASWPFGLRFEPGSRVPLHCTSVGKLLLSVQPRKRRDELIRATPLASLHRDTPSPIRTSCMPSSMKSASAAIRSTTRNSSPASSAWRCRCATARA